MDSPTWLHIIKSKEEDEFPLNNKKEFNQTLIVTAKYTKCWHWKSLIGIKMSSQQKICVFREGAKTSRGGVLTKWGVTHFHQKWGSLDEVGTFFEGEEMTLHYFGGSVDDML